MLHEIHDRQELVRQPCDNRTAAGSRGMAAALDDVLAGEEPVAVA